MLLLMIHKRISFPLTARALSIVQFLPLANSPCLSFATRSETWQGVAWRQRSGFVRVIVRSHVIQIVWASWQVRADPRVHLARRF